jgi:hypothetical protein
MMQSIQGVIQFSQDNLDLADGEINNKKEIGISLLKAPEIGETVR